MGIPSWLYYLFGVLMLAVAAYCLVLLVLSLTSRRSGGRDVDISHVTMGLAMAGMFVPAWAFGASGMWQLIFGALLVWFVVQSILSLQRFGAHLPFWVGAAAVLAAAGVLGLTSRHLAGIDVEDIEEDELEQITEQATAVTVGNDS